MKIVRRSECRSENKENVALAAALLHDIGHGPFSHAFEQVGTELDGDLDLRMMKHEHMSDWLVRNDSELVGILTKGIITLTKQC